MKGYTVVTSYTKDSTSYHVDLWTQPLHHWLIAEVYHWYDMHICRVPGFHRIEGWIDTAINRNTPVLEYLPICAKRDLRCYNLDRKHKTVRATFKISDATRERITQP